MTDAYRGDLARHYDRVYATLRDPSGDVAWYRRLARDSGGPLLELGAGTGRVLLPIAADGIPCTGLDSSPAMLAALRAKQPPPNVRLVEGSMRDFDLGAERFALVTAPFRAFQHLESVDDQLACLACVRRHLAPGGAFAFDVFAPSLAALASDDEAEHEDARYEEDGDTVIRRVAVRRDRARQVLHLALRFERQRGGRVVSEARESLRMRWFFRYEIEHLLARGGFAHAAIHGDFSGGAIDAESREIVVVARP